MRIKLFFTIACIISLQLAVSAREPSDSLNTKTFKHALGVGAGFTTGAGLSYRFIPKKFGAQLTFAPIKDDNSFWFNLGITLIYRLIQTDYTNLLLYQGNVLFYEKIDSDPYYHLDDRVTKYFNNSIGIGIEFIILKRVSFNLMGGYAAYDNFDRLAFTGEMGLYFKF